MSRTDFPSIRPPAQPEYQEPRPPVARRLNFDIAPPEVAARANAIFLQVVPPNPAAAPINGQPPAPSMRIRRPEERPQPPNGPQ